MKYWAHSDSCNKPITDPGARWQPLNQHLRQVAVLAEGFAQRANPNDVAFHHAARAAGMLHDLGKYSKDFQDKIRGANLRAPHSAHGAAKAHGWNALEAAFAIAGHHAGLPNAQGGADSLRDRIFAVKPVLNTLWQTAIEDCPELALIESALPPTGSDTRLFDLRTRMVFSCLVDADRIDSSGCHLPGPPLDAPARLERLLAHIARRASEVPDGPVKRVRNTVLETCLAAATRAGNLFSLTVPTGGAKTLASMAFALKRAMALDLRRVIVVIPYLSIIEQNAQVFIGALGPDAVLEHHSGDIGADETEDIYENPAKRRATENWDAPIIVTTSVRFFESLFSHRPADLRRVHNVARSVVILDEVQTLPRNFLQPMLSAMQDLAVNWNTTFLFCTATQPAFEGSRPGDPRWLRGTVQEIMPQPRELFTQLKRVDVEWPQGTSSWEQIAAGLRSSRRALCIVNTRAQALALYREVLKDAETRDAMFHLSARMCPAHRLDTIAQVKSRLDSPNAPCIVVSTQLVEAGVDLDFPVVYRAVGPLDSIAQAAGRCDREGLLTASLGRPGGRLFVFEPEQCHLPKGVYTEATQRTQALIAEGGLSIDDPDCIRRYFDRLYGEANLGREIQAMREQAKFRDLGNQFEMIPENTESVFVPYNADARSLIAELQAVGILHGPLRRRLQRYSIGLYRNEFDKANALGVVTEVRPEAKVWICAEGFYDTKIGFDMERTSDQLVL